MYDIKERQLDEEELKAGNWRKYKFVDKEA